MISAMEDAEKEITHINQLLVPESVDAFFEAIGQIAVQQAQEQDDGAISSVRVRVVKYFSLSCHLTTTRFK